MEGWNNICSASIPKGDLQFAGTLEPCRACTCKSMMSMLPNRPSSKQPRKPCNRYHACVTRQADQLRTLVYAHKRYAKPSKADNCQNGKRKPAAARPYAPISPPQSGPHHSGTKPAQTGTTKPKACYAVLI